MDVLGGQPDASLYLEAHNEGKANEQFEEEGQTQPQCANGGRLPDRPRQFEIASLELSGRRRIDDTCPLLGGVGEGTGPCRK